MRRQVPHHVQAASLPDIEAILKRLWAEILVIPPESVGSHVNFFAMGGESSHVVRLMDRVNCVFFAEHPDCELAVTDLFDHATIDALARHLSDRPSGAATPHVTEGKPGSLSESVAIIGISLRFPGARNVATFWDNIRRGTESIRSFADTELLGAGVSAALVGRADYVKRGGSPEDLDLFDASYFGLTPREAARISPQQRVLLECAEEALQDGGYGARERAQRVAVVVGIAGGSASDDEVDHPQDIASVVANTSTATRISYMLDLTGASFSLDTACSSSLVAVHQACRALLQQECEMALAGGASIRQVKPRGYVYEGGGILSADGRCRPFDQQAGGTVFTSGAAMVLLKRLEDARSDGDTIYAVIKGTAVNNDGNVKMGYAAPSAAGQASVIRNAQAAAKVEASSIQYVETHGTATQLGDQIEIAALRDVFAPAGHAKSSCSLGALKASVGHLEAAAGIAGLIKTALVLRHREIPPIVNLRVSNDRIDFAPFEVSQTLHTWTARGAARRAGVSSFGIGGTNAHAVLEEAASLSAGSTHRSSHLLVVSARTDAALRATCRDLSAYLARPGAASLADVACTLQLGRRMHACRRFVVCSSHEEAVELLKGYGDMESMVRVREALQRPVVFMFPDEASHCSGMLRGLYDEEPVFKENVDRCAALLRGEIDVDLRNVLYPQRKLNGAAHPPVPADCTPFGPIAVFVMEYSLARLWQSWGIRSASMIGQGVGERAADCMSGACTLEEALRAVVLGGGMNRPGQDKEFSEATERALLGPTTLFLEVGPRAWLSSRVRQTAEAETHVIVASAREPQDERHDGCVLLNALGELWQAGGEVDWHAFNIRNVRRRVALPTYPFERQACHAERRAPEAPLDAVSDIKRAELTEWFYVPTWKRLPGLVRRRPSGSLSGGGHGLCCVLFEQPGRFGSELAERLRADFEHVVRVSPGKQFGISVKGVYTFDPSDESAYARLVCELKASGRSPQTLVHAWNVARVLPDQTVSQDEQLALSVYSVLYLCKALDQQLGSHALTLTLLTSGAHIVFGDELMQPERATLTCASGVIAREFPQLTCHTIDVVVPTGGGEGWNRLIDSVAAEIVSPAPESAIALRGRYRWARSFEQRAPAKAASEGSLLRDEGVYLITGGLGAIGLALAQFLASTVRARLILTTRSAFPPRHEWDSRLRDPGSTDRVSRCIHAIRAMESAGAQVLIAHGDVTDSQLMDRVVELAHLTFGNIHGVIHAAGVAGGGVIQLKTSETVGKVLAPKIAGSYVVMNAVRRQTLDFVVYCSSLASVLSPAGQFDYGAANAFQDALAEAHDRDGTTRYISVNWDAWQEAGMAVAKGRDVTHGISPEEGKAAFGLILSNPAPRWLISTRPLHPAHGPQRERRPPVLTERTRQAATNGTYVAPRNDTEQTVADIWRDLLGIEGIGVFDDFFELGGDSLLAIELNSMMSARLARSVPLTLLVLHPTIAQIAALPA